MRPKRPRPDAKLDASKPQLDIEAIVEQAQIEELSPGTDQMRAFDAEQPILIPGSALKPMNVEAISIRKPSVLPSPDQIPSFEGPEKKQRNYLADVKDAIRKSTQKVREKRAHKESEGLLSLEDLRGDKSMKKKSSLEGAATIGLFTPLQLVNLSF